MALSPTDHEDDVRHLSWLILSKSHLTYFGSHKEYTIHGERGWMGDAIQGNLNRIQECVRVSYNCVD